MFTCGVFLRTNSKLKSTDSAIIYYRDEHFLDFRNPITLCTLEKKNFTRNYTNNNKLLYIIMTNLYMITYGKSTGTSVFERLTLRDLK